MKSEKVIHDYMDELIEADSLKYDSSKEQLLVTITVLQTLQWVLKDD